MQGKSRIIIMIAVGAAAVLVVASLAGLPRMLGAHPWWARQSGIIGGVGGAIFWLVLWRARIGPAAQLILAHSALSSSAASVYFGKQAFVGSYAENALAGRFWYFGWFALSGSVACLLAALAARLLLWHDKP